MLVSYHSLAGLGVELVGLWLRQFCPIGGWEDHPITKLCEVRGHSCYHRSPNDLLGQGGLGHVFGN